MDDINITIENNGDDGKSVAQKNNRRVGEMTFTIKNETLTIKHTEVNDQLQGEGVGRKLLDAVVTLAREKNLKIVPLCTYAKHVFEEDPTIADVLISN